MRRWLMLFAMLLALPWVSGCRGNAPDPLKIAAAGNLAPVLPDLLEAFTTQTGQPAIPVLASSGKLAQQITQGAPYDVFLSADETYVDDLIRQGFILPDSRRVYALGVLVIAVRCDAPVAITGLQDLTAPAVKRVALANPDHAPYGRAAREALQRAGLWSALAPRLVFGDTVRHAMQFVVSGNAPVGLVALSVAQDTPCVSTLEVPADLYPALRQTAGIVARSSHPDAARQFLAFLESPTAQETFRRYGYGLPAAVQDPVP